MNEQTKKAAGVLLSFGVSLLLVGLLYAPLSISGVTIVGPQVWKFALAILTGLGLWAGVPWLLTGERPQITPSLLPYLLTFWVLALSDYVARRFCYFATPIEPGTVITIFVVCALIFRHVTDRAIISPSLAAFTAVICVAGVYYRVCAGELIFSDDHPSFFYRLQLLTDRFPFIPFYNPQWNGGYSAREFFATGALNIFFFLFPFLKLGSLNRPENYSLLIGIIPLVILPLSVFASCTVLRLGSVARAVAVVLSLAISLDFFEWFLRYGTLGFLTSLGLIPLVYAFSYRLLLGEEQLGRRGLIALLIVSTLCFFWTLSVAAFVPLGVYSLAFALRTRSWSRLKMALFFVALFLTLNGAWLMTFVRESKVSRFVSSSHLPGAEKKQKSSFVADAKKSSKKLVELLTKMNPALLFLGVPGLFLLRERRLRIAIALTLFWLLTLAAVGDVLKPQLELRRMSLVAAVILLLPSSVCLEALLSRPKDSFRAISRVMALAVAAGSLGILVLVPLNASAVYANRSDVLFHFAPRQVSLLADALKRYNSGGRALFLGFILHELGETGPGHQDGGHIAPLALWSERELIASHYFHARWSSIDPIPDSFRARGREGIEEFLDLMNVTEVITFRKEWFAYCQGDLSYVLRASLDRFHVFTRSRYTPTPLIEGDAEIVEATPGKLVIRPKTERVVLKYRYLPALRANTSEVRVSGKFLFDEQVGAGQTEPFEALQLEINRDFVDSSQTVELSY